MKSWKTLHLLTFLISLWTAFDAVSWADCAGSCVLSSRYTSTRAAGMGDAFLPLADEPSSALFYNPAGIAAIHGFQFEPLNLELSANAASVGTAGIKAYDSYSLSGNSDTLKKNAGTTLSNGAMLLPSFGFPGFAAGVLYQNKFFAQEQTDEAGKINYRSMYQLIPAAGFGIPLANGIVRIGYSVQWVTEATGSQTVSDSSSSIGYNQNLNQGGAFSHNFGYALTLPYKYLPEWNVVVRNIGGAHYTGTKLYSFSANPAGTPTTDPMSIDTSFSIQPKLGNGTSVNLVFEEKDITNKSKISIMDRLAFGTEWVVRRTFFLRGGFGNGYPSAGFGIKTPGGELSFSWSSVELSDTYHGDRDIEYTLQYQMRVF
jgi:hypothetical protein